MIILVQILLMIENNTLDVAINAAIPVAESKKKTTLPNAIPAITPKECLNPLEAASKLTAITAGLGEITTTKVVINNSIKSINCNHA